MTKNQVMLYKLLVNFPNDYQDNLAEAMTIQRNLMVYGYMLDEAAFDQLKRTDLSNAISFYEESAEMLRDMLGGKHNYESLYKNFPNDVLSMSQSELYWNRIMHYYGQKNFGPKGEAKDEMFEKVNYKMIKGTDENGIMKVYEILAGSGQSLTPLDLKVLKYFSTVKDLPIVTVPFKENLAVLASNVDGFKVNTVVDVLRIAVAMSGGDPSLPPLPKKLKTQGAKWKEREAERDAHKFRLNENQKVRLMDLFENSNLSLSDLNQGSRRGRFIRLAEVLRVQNFVSSHGKTSAAFNHLRNQVRKGKPKGMPKIRTWNSQVESQFKIGFIEGLSKLAERPGEFLRKLDLLIRKNVDNQELLNEVLFTLATVGERTSNKVLFEVFTHFSGRNEDCPRSIFVKGARSRTELPTLKKLPKEVINQVKSTVLDIIKSKLASLPPLGKVYIDPELKSIPLPTNMRSLSESLTPVIRGQVISLDSSKKVIRAYVHWYDQNGNEDLDLHGYLYKEDFKSPVTMGFNGIHSNSYGTYSGDVRHRKGACAEYVDIDVKNVIKAGFRYFVPMVHNYSNRPLSSMKDTVVGFMYRDSPASNKTWLPESVEMSFKPSGKSVSVIVGAFDLKELKYIHIDCDWDKGSGRETLGMAKVVKESITEPEISIYDLLLWHADARGLSASIEESVTQFMLEDFKSDYTAILPFMGV